MYAYAYMHMRVCVYIYISIIHGHIYPFGAQVLNEHPSELASFDRRRGWLAKSDVFAGLVGDQTSFVCVSHCMHQTRIVCVPPKCM